MAEVDTSIYKGNVAQNPLEIAGKIVDYDNKLLHNAQGQQQLQANNLKLATERFGIVNGAAAGILADPELGTRDVTKKLWDVLGRLTKGDAMTAQHAVEFMKGFPQEPRLQAQAIKNVHAQTLSAWEKGKAYLGETQGVGTRGGTKFVQVPALGGGPAIDRGYLPNTLDPSVQQVNPDLSKSYVGGVGNPALHPPPGFPEAPYPRPAARAPQSQSKPVVAAAPPGQAEAANVAGGASGGALGDARNRSLNYQQEVNPLEQAIPALEKLGTKGTGPGTDSINHLKSFVLSNVPGADFKGLKDEVATYDKAKKYLTDFVNQNGNSGTNDKLAAAFAGNPSVNISNAAAVDVAKTALTLRRFKQAQLLAFENSGKPDADFAKEAGKFAREHDPRAYGFDLMTPAERKKVIESLPKGKRELFMMDVQDALSQGMLKPPRAR